MLSLDYKGNFYPCIRYMPSSIGTDCPEVCIGNVNTGMVGRSEGSPILKLFDNITRRSQSNDICYDCPIASGCAWCFAPNTFVTTSNGNIKIKDIEKGNLVLGQDGKYHPVAKVLIRPSNCIQSKRYRVTVYDPYDIKTVNRQWIDLYTTEEHPFFAKKCNHIWTTRRLASIDNKVIDIIWEEPSWVPASELTGYHEVLHVDGKWKPIMISMPTTVNYDLYNLVVEDDPTFYANGILVHNCSGLCHQTFNTANKRITFYCAMVIAEALANVYYWNKLAIAKPEYGLPVRKNNVPTEWALKVIDNNELEQLRLLEDMAMMIKTK